LVRKLQEKESFGRPRRRYEDNIKMDLRGIGSLVRIFKEGIDGSEYHPMVDFQENEFN
jgi:hypothetical protein